MAYTTIKKPSDYFNTKLYSGNSGTQSITGVNFQPDFAWIKNRTNVSGYGHRLLDGIRGATKELYSNSTATENTVTDGLTSFNTDGFSLGANPGVNNSGDNFVAWNWKANGAGSANTDGSISSTVSANTTSGFSIVKYTGTGANATVGHGLGVAPKMIHVKGIDVGTTNWLTGGSNISSNWGSSLHLNTTGAIDTYNYWQNQAPNANTFALSTDGANNQSGINFIAYCFADVQGFSKFGSYTGNGNADGPFIYTGFKPAWVLIKHASGGTAGGESWNLQDIKRSTYNPSIISLFPNTNDADNSTTNNSLDILSNGFKVRTVDNRLNNSGASYIYMAFAEEPLVGDNPATAR